MATTLERIDSDSASPALPPLRRLYFYLTQGCNQACRHCWMAPRFDPHGDRYPTLPVALFEKALGEAKPLGLIGVKLCGGEPLLHPEIITLLEIIRHEGLALVIETNGLLCTPEIARAIVGCSSSFVSVSMDGVDAATYEWLRGVKGSFAMARQGVRNLAAAGVPTQIIMTLVRRNAHQVAAMVEMAQALGASSVKFNIVQPTARGEAFHESDEALSVSEILDLGALVIRELQPRTRLKLYVDYPPAFRPLGRIASGEDTGACGVLSILGVLASGHYALCGIGEQVDDLIFGRVGEDPLAQVWRDSAPLEELRAGLPERLGGICRQCLMRYRCMGSCVAQTYYRTGSFWQPHWFCELAAQASLFPTSRLAPESGMNI